jgi:general secretion pathway protein D
MKTSIHVLLLTGLLAGLVTMAHAQNATNAPGASPPAGATSQQPAPPPEPAAVPQTVAPATNALPPVTSEYSAEGLRINFRGAPLNLVLDYLSEAAGFIINKQTEVRGTVEIWSKQPVTKDEAVELLSSVLKKNGYAVTRNGRILNIIALDSAKTSSELDVVTGSDPEEVEKSDEMETRIIPVRYASATQLVPNLEMLLPTTANLTANESANTLILVATRSDIKRMLKIVSALDNSMASASSIKVRPLLYADAKETANLITQLFTPQNANQGGGNRGNFFNFGGPGGGGPGGFGGGGGGFRQAFAQAMAGGAGGGNRGGGNAAATKVVAVADDRSNAVVISAPSDLLATIEEMIQKIDQPIADVMQLQVFKLANADPTELADQLTSLFPDETNSNNNNQNNMPFFFGRFGGPGRGNLQTSTTPSDHMKKLGKVVAVPDPRTGSIIIAASKTLMPQIEDMVKELDSDKGKKEIVGFYELQNADPQDVYQNLQDLFNRINVRMQNNNNQNSFLGRNNPLTQRETQNQQATTGANTGFGSMTSQGTGGGGRFGGQ